MTKIAGVVFRCYTDRNKEYNRNKEYRKRKKIAKLNIEELC